MKSVVFTTANYLGITVDGSDQTGGLPAADDLQAKAAAFLYAADIEFPAYTISYAKSLK